MPKGKPWAPEQEKDLRRLLEAGYSISVIAKKLGKSRDSVKKKVERLGLEVVVPQKTQGSTTSRLELPKELPSVEYTLKTLSAALKALEEPGLSKSEVMRLRSLIQGVKIYKELFADYVNYSSIEAKLAQAIEKYEALFKAKEK